MRVKSYFAVLTTILMVGCQVAFAESEGTFENPYIIDETGAGYDTFLTQNNDSAVFYIRGEVVFQRPVNDGFKQFITKSYELHVLDGGILNLGHENFFQSGYDTYKGKIIIHSGGELRYGSSANDIWYGNTDGNAKIANGKITLCNLDKLMAGKATFELSDNATYEINKKAIVGYGPTGVDNSTQQYTTDYGAVFIAPSESQMRINDGGSFILIKGAKNRISSQLNLYGNLEIESGGTFLAKDDAVLNNYGNIVVHHGGTFSASSNTYCNMGGTFTVLSGATVLLSEESTLNILSDGNFVVESDGKLDVGANATVNGHIQVKGDVFLRAADISKIGGSKWVLAEGGEIYSVSEGLENLLTNAKREGIVEIDGTNYHRWVFEQQLKEDNSDENGAGNTSGNNESQSGSSPVENQNYSGEQNHSNGINNSTTGSTGGANRSLVRPDSMRGDKDMVPPLSASRSNESESRNSQKKITILRIGEHRYISHSEQGAMEGFAEVAPALIGEKTMLPVRLISELLGLQVDYDDEMKVVNIFRSSKADGIQLDLGTWEKNLRIGGRSFAQRKANLILDKQEKREISVAIEKGRMILPLREIQEIFSLLEMKTTTEWKHETKEIIVVADIS